MADLRIEPVTDPSDFDQIFHCATLSFGIQAKDAIWMAMNPGWDTPEGAARGASVMRKRWESTTRNSSGDPNTIFLKATLENRIVGSAIWVQASSTPGQGDPPPSLAGAEANALTIHPENEKERRFLVEVDMGLHGRRAEVLKESRDAKMVLDFCIVDPSYQGRGIAKKLVKWGVDEAERRGGLECVTEASSMGRHVYERLGFVQEGGEMDYGLSEEFRGRKLPSNVFMRTGLKK